MTNVLIVEDNPIMQTIAEKMFEKLGHTSDVAATGAESLAMSNAQHYPVILLDCQIPIIDGYEVATELRKREGSGKKPKRSHIIACTANCMNGDEEKCLNAGMDDYIQKPLTQEALRSALEKII